MALRGGNQGALAGSSGQAALGLARLLAIAQAIVDKTTATEAKKFDAARWLGQWIDSPDIERGFKVLKSEIKIAPVFHRLPERIRAHASICFMALILYCVTRQRLKAAGRTYRAIERRLAEPL